MGKNSNKQRYDCLDQWLIGKKINIKGMRKPVAKKVNKNVQTVIREA